MAVGALLTCLTVTTKLAEADEKFKGKSINHIDRKLFQDEIAKSEAQINRIFQMIAIIEVNK